jgi:hypothetical protein
VQITPRGQRYVNLNRRRNMAELETAITNLNTQLSRLDDLPPIALTPFEGRLDKRSFQTFIKVSTK